MLDRFDRREFTLWRIFWYAFTFFYLLPVAFAVTMVLLVVVFGVRLPR